MLLPVALALHQSDVADVTVLGLTTAADEAKKINLPLLQYKNFDYLRTNETIIWGKEMSLALGVNAAIEAEETEAYLGINFFDMVQTHGMVKAQDLYREYGRHSFLPINTMKNVLERFKPDLLLISNSPRSEQAAGIAARSLGIKCVCVNALLAIDEIAWLKNPQFADIVCVLNSQVKDFLCSQGRLPEQIRVTGNPAFDSLHDEQTKQSGRIFRMMLQEKLGIRCDFVIVWASQPEPNRHPTAPNKIGNPELPSKILDCLKNWLKTKKNVVLVVRPHPSEPAPIHLEEGIFVCTHHMLPISVVLQSCDALVTLTSTVGVEAWVLGKKVLQVKGSIFDHALPIAELGLAQACTLDNLPQYLSGAYTASIYEKALNNDNGHENKPRTPSQNATEAVVSVINELLA
jgi:UDP-N-acetylglucosamine 2-epimerase